MSALQCPLLSAYYYRRPSLAIYLICVEGKTRPYFVPKGQLTCHVKPEPYFLESAHI